MCLPTVHLNALNTKTLSGSSTYSGGVFGQVRLFLSYLDTKSQCKLTKGLLNEEMFYSTTAM